MKRILALILFPIFTFAEICVFTPPSEWERVLPKSDNPYIQAYFVGKGGAIFQPNLNLAIEMVDVPLKEYLKDVREIHELEMKVQWRDLGPFTFRAGKGRLTEITSPSSLGEIKTLQGILVQGGYAYILTGAAAKDEFSKFQIQFLSSIRSLTLTSDLFSMISDETLKSALLQTFDQYNHLSSSDERQKEWDHLQKMISKDYSSLGSYWAQLMLKEGYQRIFKVPVEQKPVAQ